MLIARDRRRGRGTDARQHARGSPLLSARCQPMSLAWGSGAGGVGNSALDLDVTNLNLADWRPFLGNAVSANLHLELSSQQGGKQLGFDLNSQVNDLRLQSAAIRPSRRR